MNAQSYWHVPDVTCIAVETGANLYQVFPNPIQGRFVLGSNSCTGWRSIFKRVSQDVGRTDCSENLHALPFNDDWYGYLPDPSRWTVPLRCRLRKMQCDICNLGFGMCCLVASLGCVDKINKTKQNFMYANSNLLTKYKNYIFFLFISLFFYAWACMCEVSK